MKTILASSIFIRILYFEWLGSSSYSFWSLLKLSEPSPKYNNVIFSAVKSLCTLIPTFWNTIWGKQGTFEIGGKNEEQLTCLHWFLDPYLFPLLPFLFLDGTLLQQHDLDWYQVNTPFLTENRGLRKVTDRLVV